jgi:hypothetical protein
LLLTWGKKQLYLNLLILVHQDVNLAERLIVLEHKRNPKLARKALIKNAAERLLDDRR